MSTLQKYKRCLKKEKKSPRKLCARGYCSAKARYRVYPSAYANMHASSVCSGKTFDIAGNKGGYRHYTTNKTSPLQRWVKERWVNVCEKGNGPGGYKPCGRKKSSLSKSTYPYCRPYYKQKGTTVKTVHEIGKAKLKEMCRRKRSRTQGVNGKPVRVRLKGGGTAGRYIIPKLVRRVAKMALVLRRMGFIGGTTTGWKRAAQLARSQSISHHDALIMRAWFARHGPTAKNGGTSFPGYKRWVQNGKPTDIHAQKTSRGALAWLLWGGTPAYRWIKSLPTKTHR